MTFTFAPEEIFSKGIVYAEFFDIATDNLLGFSRMVSGFNPQGSMNAGDVEGGVGNQLQMRIPDTCRLNITATTADSHLNNMALPVGAELSANGVIETSKAITASAATLQVSNAVAPLGGQNGAVAYVLSSSGTDNATVQAASGSAHAVDASGNIADFVAIPGNVYCVKYFTTQSSALQLSIPALFGAAVVRAHFAVNCYAKKSGNDVMASSLVKIRHYYFPYYSFTNPLNDTLSQTATGTVDLSGTCLSYQQAADLCGAENAGYYGYIVDEIIGDEAGTSLVDGIYFIGLGSGLSVVKSTTRALPVKYSVSGVLADISDMSQVTFTAASSAVSFADPHSNVMTAGSTAGNTTVTVSVTNSKTGETYSDTIPVTVTAS